MAKNSDLRSVRIEVEADPGLTGEAPEVVARRDGSMVGVLSGVIGLSLLGLLMVLALRSADPPTAGTATVVPTSTTVARPVEESNAASDAATEGTDVAASLFEQTAGLSQLQSVVRVEAGFLGLSWTQSPQQLPEVVRSSDGVDWSTVEVVFDDSIAAAGVDAPYERIYEELIRTQDGYALLTTTVWFKSDTDLSPTAARIERLMSPDGVHWTLDPSFGPVEVADGLLRVLSHGENSFVYLVQPTSPANTPLNDLLDGADTVEPDRLELLRECAASLRRGGANDSSVWVGHRGHTTQMLTDADSRPIQPSVADDGTAVAFDLSGPVWLDEPACDGFMDLDAKSPALVVSNPQSPTGPVRVPIPEGVDVTSLFSVRAEPLIAGRAMLLLIGSAVTSIDIDTGEWSEILALPFRVGDETSVRFTAEGSQLIHLDSSRVTAVDLGTGEGRWREDVGGGNRPGFPWMLYADNEMVFAQGGNSMFKVDLPAS